MVNSDLMEKFIVDGGDSLTDSINSLLEGGDEVSDVLYKTEINNPSALATLQTYSEVCKDIGLDKFADFIDCDVLHLLQNNISLNRSSRKEYLQGLNAVKESFETMELGDRLKTNMKE